jgi:RNA polymerase sigma factor for flagellar operon FliA
MEARDRESRFSGWLIFSQALGTAENYLRKKSQRRTVLEFRAQIPGPTRDEESDQLRPMAQIAMQAFTRVARGLVTEPASALTGNGQTGPEENASQEITSDVSRMVRGLAGRLHARLPHGCGIEISDLVQAGNVGVLKAANNFQSHHGAPFALYAKFRIRGEMLDLVRRHAGREHAGPFLQSSGHEMPESESTIPAPAECSPQSSALRQQRTAIIWEELQRLPARDRAVVRLRYSREMTLREIGEELHVNESRACQIHQGALTRLKKALWSRGVRDFSHL